MIYKTRANGEAYRPIAAYSQLSTLRVRGKRGSPREIRYLR